MTEDEEFEFRARLEREAAAAAATQKPEPAKSSGIDRAAKITGMEAPVGLLEGALNMGTGMIAKPVSDVAGLAAMAKELFSPSSDSPDISGFKNEVANKLTYQPRTKAGELVSEYNPLAVLAKGVSAISGGANKAITSGPVTSAVGNAVEEGINQASGFLGYGVSKAAGPVGEYLRGKAEKTMQSALKPTLKAQQTKQAEVAIKTLLDDGINVTQGGVDALRKRIDGLNEKIATVIDNSPATINKAQVGKRLIDTLDQFEKQVAPMSDVAAIQRAWEQFMDHPLLKEREIPVQLAQELKQGTYKALGDKSYTGELKGAEIEAHKALARGLKEEIAKAVPEVRTLNAEESALINTLNVTERRVMMAANNNPVGLGWMTTNPVKFAG